MTTSDIWFILIDQDNRPITSTFKVPCSGVNDVADLKKKVKEQEQLDYPVSRLEMWRCTKPGAKFDGDDEETHNQIQELFSLKQVERVRERKKIAQIGLSEEETLLIRTPGTLSARPSSENNEEASDAVGEMEKQFQKYTSAVLRGHTPSDAAKSINYRKNQHSSTTALLDGRFTEDGATTTALPVELYHPAFATFLFHASDSEANIPVEILRKTARLMRKLSLLVGSESERDRDCRSLLAEILGTPLDTATNSDRTCSDFISLHATPLNVSAAPHIGEIKNDMGTGGSDPSVQASFSYARYYCQPDRTPIRDLCCCPALVLALAGPWISVLGAVMTSRTIVQRLCGYQWSACSRTLDKDQVISLARILYAFRLGIAELKDYYGKLERPKPEDVHPDCIAPRFCPSITSYIDSSNATIKFRYVKPLEQDHTCVTFLAKILNGDLEGQLVVVKFVRDYGVDAHRWMARHGFAPELFHHGSLGDKYGDLALVVMEYIKGNTLHQFYDGAAIPEEVRKAVRIALDKLEEGGFIFGDLRTPNIMLSSGDQVVEKRLRFIDFDWACRVNGEEQERVRYPPHLSEVIRDMSGADDFDIIERKHQEAMFKYL